MHLDIEKMVYGGEGLGRLPSDAKGRGKAVFVPFVLPGEQVEALIVEARSGFARAKLDRVLAPAAERTEPGCQYFARCGGCHYQHATYHAQLRFKTDILRETLRRTAKVALEQEIQVHASEPWAYRNRTRMRLQHEPQFTLGYHRYNSHELLPVEACPISSPLINQAIAAIWETGREGTVPKIIHGMQFFANDDDKELLMEAHVHPGGVAKDWEQFASRLRAAVPQVVGVVEFVTSPAKDEWSRHAPPSAEARSFRGCGGKSLTYHAVGHHYRVSAGSFFQTNRFLVNQLVQVVTAHRSGKTALELYAGVGLFTLALAQSFEHVIAVEASPHSFADLQVNAPANVKPIRATTERFLAERAVNSELELVVVDPPRAGLGQKTARALGHMPVSRVTYVSCDPATLSRDLRVLLECGFRVEQAHLVDLFPQTFHVETVLHLAR